MDRNKNTIIAIHQPNFFPWLGYFDKIVRSDVFVFMDNAQLPRTGSGTWVNRVKVLVNKEPRWITVPVKKTGGICRIYEAEIDNSAPWRKKLVSTLRMNYARAPFYKETIVLITDLIEYPTISLSEYNINAITVLCDTLGVDSEKLILGRDLDADGKATDLLISMTNAASGNVYMCGGGAGGYQDDGEFARAGISLVYQNFTHPTYLQGGSEFTPGLSIIDALMFCGVGGVKSMLAGDIRDQC